MRARAKVKGFCELDRKLARIGRSLPARVKQRILVEAAAPLLAEMQFLAPVLTGGLRGSLGIFEEDERVLVGPSRGAGSIAHFHEFGTVAMPAHPFLVPAYDNARGAVVAGVAIGIRAAIDRAKG
ncbi:HK97-gp10 family putative phage morphogenesis protein [Aurantiacibacter luteus]|uniref:HK97-gp10 family putative phage morphogenesis protein n=1 Tax=Aurantiacibacter luteus TaxID=1581420 RepID=UPI000699B99F|nr:HK97-gp10 family putative phage morphogenesis protein [Aurantiacibacter luteus]